MPPRTTGSASLRCVTDRDPVSRLHRTGDLDVAVPGQPRRCPDAFLVAIRALPDHAHGAVRAGGTSSAVATSPANSGSLLALLGSEQS